MDSQIAPDQPTDAQVKSRGSVQGPRLSVLAKVPVALFILLTLTVVVFFLWQITPYLLNIPFMDDFDAIVNFLLRMRSQEKWPDSLDLILAQHHEHRIAFLRLITLFQVWTFGVVDFKIQQLLGVTLAIGTAAILVGSLKPNNSYRWGIGLVVTLLVLQPGYAAIFLWAMAALSNVPVMFFAGLTFVGLSLERRFSWGVFTAMLCSLLGLFSQGNGVAIFMVGVFLLLVRQKYAATIGWVAWSAACLYTYFWNFHAVEFHPSSMESILHPFRFLEYYFCFLGSSVGIDSYRTAFSVGLVLVLIVIAALCLKVHERYPCLTAFCLFSLITAGLNALSRSMFGPEFVLASANARYRWFGALSLASGLSLFLLATEGRRLHRWGLIVALCFSLISSWRASVRTHAEFRLLSAQIALGSEIFRRSQSLNGGLQYPSGQLAADWLKQAGESGLYSVPSLPPLETQSFVNLPCEESFGRKAPGVHNIDAFLDLGKEFMISGWALRHDMRLPRTNIRLIFRDMHAPHHCHAAATFLFPRPDVATAYGNRNALESGYAAYIAKQGLPEGKYSLLLGVEDAQGRAWTPTKLELTVENGKSWTLDNAN